MYRRYQPNTQADTKSAGAPHGNQNNRRPAQQQKNQQTNRTPVQNNRPLETDRQNYMGEPTSNRQDSSSGGAGQSNAGSQRNGGTEISNGQQGGTYSSFGSGSRQNTNNQFVNARDGGQKYHQNRQDPFLQNGGGGSFGGTGSRKSRTSRPMFAQKEKKQKNFLFDLLPPALYNAETKKILGLISAEDLLLVALIFMFLDNEQGDNQLLSYALLYILVSDYIDLPV